MRKSNRKNRKAFTLLEILLVAAILVILASMATLAFRSIGQETTASLARTEIESFEQAATAFSIRHMRWPQSLNELFQPVNGTTAILEGDQMDPWGNEYQFRIDSELDKVIITSAGPDGQINTGDDVTNDPKAAQNRQT